MTDPVSVDYGINIGKDLLLPGFFALIGGGIGFIGSWLVFKLTTIEQICGQLIQEYQKLDTAIYSCADAQEAWFYGRNQRTGETFDQIEDRYIRNSRQISYSLMFIKTQLHDKLSSFEQAITDYMTFTREAMRNRETHSSERHKILIEKKNALFERLEPTFLNVICRFGEIKSLKNNV